MPIRLLLALLVLVATPLLMLGWILNSAMAAREADARKSVESLLVQRLSEAGEHAGDRLESYRQHFLDSCAQAQDRTEWLSLKRRKDPRVQLIFLLDAQGRVLYPLAPTQADAKQITQFLIMDELIQGRPRGEVADAVVKDQHVASWMPWYRDQGLQLVLWIECPDASVVGILLNRAAWIADLIGQLPDSELATTDAADNPLATRASLIDAAGTNLYRWGTSPSAAVSETRESDQWYVWAETALPQPLAAWRLRYEGVTPLVGNQAGVSPVIIALTGLAVMLVALGAYVATSLRRQMQLARRQVSFAGQVSHELRTPLTNIRLYAEMAQCDLDALPESSIRETLENRLQVINSETERLGRLCAGVLDLARRPYAARGRRWDQTIPDEVIDDALEQFSPAFERMELVVERTPAAGQCVWLDRETLEIVLVNLLSNVEKYAASGKWLGVDSNIESDVLVVRIEDRGPGIPRRFRERIFRPFFRIDSSISAPTGTGIGLSIARQRVADAGGKLFLVPTPRGACFELRMPLRFSDPQDSAKSTEKVG